MYSALPYGSRLKRGPAPPPCYNKFRLTGSSCNFDQPPCSPNTYYASKCDGPQHDLMSRCPRNVKKKETCLTSVGDTSAAVLWHGAPLRSQALTTATAGRSAFTAPGAHNYNRRWIYGRSWGSCFAMLGGFATPCSQCPVGLTGVGFPQPRSETRG